MEEQIQSIITNIFDYHSEGGNLLIQKLYKLSFNENLKPDQISKKKYNLIFKNNSISMFPLYFFRI